VRSKPIPELFRMNLSGDVAPTEHFDDSEPAMMEPEAVHHFGLRRAFRADFRNSLKPLIKRHSDIVSSSISASERLNHSLDQIQFARLSVIVSKINSRIESV